MKLSTILNVMAGVAAAAVLAVGGYWFGQSQAEPQIPEIPLHAFGASGDADFAVSTGPIDDDIEGYFVLDFVTGELHCYVINPRSAKLASGGYFKTNVVAALSVERGKTPNYRLVTGAANFLGAGGGGSRPGGCVCYVLDANTGKFAAYGLSWNRTASTSGKFQGGELILLDGGTTRQAE